VKEGMKEQTKRHAYLLKLLGINQVVVAINKMDLVNYKKEKFEKVKNDVLDYLGAIEIVAKSVIPISAYYGDNVVKKSNEMQWYKGKTILEALDSFKKTYLATGFKFAVQDVYKIENKKVCVGNILTGMIREGEKVKIFPKGKNSIVKEILTFEGKLKKAKGPKAIGMLLDETVRRGEIISKGKRPFIANKIEPTIFCLVDHIKEGEKYLFRCTTQETECKIEKIIEKIDITTLKKMEPNGILNKCDIGKIKLSFRKLIALESFRNLQELGRFVLEKDGKIIAGGIIV